MKIAFVAALFGVPCLLSGQSQRPNTRIDHIKNFVKAEMSKQKIPGISLAVVSGGRLLFAGSFGSADLENHVSATKLSLFRTASLAKPITATAAMALAESGKLNLDAPIQKYCPEFPEKPWPITSRQLLSHQSGIRHYNSENPDDPEVSSTHHYARLSDAFALFGKDPLAHQPGTAFLYSTFGYTVLGCVLEGAAGEPYLKLLQDYVFTPAKMLDSTIDDARKLIPNRVRGYALTPGGELVNAGCIDSSYKTPAGGLLTTATDLAGLVQSLYSGKLLKPETLDAMWTPQPTSLGKVNGYAFGWGVFYYRGERAIAHSGNQQGASATLLLLPEKQFVVAILANLESADLEALAHSIADTEF